MYITYDTHQNLVIHTTGQLGPSIITGSSYAKELQQDERLDNPHRPSSFKPTKLVRAEDMQVVDGSSVKSDEYWALSYSWNQSGDVVKKKDEQEYTLIDKSEHTIITYGKTWINRKRQAKVDPSTKCMQTVNFQGLIQRICKDFGIRFIWFDQMCIDQNDEVQKRQEIQQMHLVYHHAYCTVVLVPEFDFTGKKMDEYSSIDIANIDNILASQWSHRAWTLEEAYMSRKLLFLGRNVHMWSYSAEDAGYLNRMDNFLYSICKPSMIWNASTALWYARKRISTKPHDRMFALANMFPDIMKGVNFSYKQPLLPLAIRFYGLLAEKDLSVLCFGKPACLETEEQKRFYRRAEDDLLPSWTGIKGVHVSRGMAGDNLYPVPFTDYTVTGSSLYLRNCSCVAATIKSSRLIKSKEDSWLLSPRHYPIDARLTLKLRRGKALTFVDTSTLKYDGRRIDDTDPFELETTHVLPVDVREDYMLNTLSKPSDHAGYLSLVEDCSDCLILVSVRFALEWEGSGLFAHPVVTKDGDHYKSIGICFMAQVNYLNSDVKTEQTIVIK